VDRRAICRAIGAAVLTTFPVAALAQARVQRIAFVHPAGAGVADATLAVFRTELRELGHQDGRDLVIETYWGNNRAENLARIASEVVESRPDLIVTATAALTALVKKATTTIPIVFATAADPVELGLVTSLQRPGGNVTGVRVYLAELTPKAVELAREAFPAARRLAVLVHTRDASYKQALKAFQESAPRFRFEPLVVQVAGPEDFERAFAQIAQRKADAVIVTTLALFNDYRAQLGAHSVKAGVPLIGNDLRYAEAGVLLSYGTSFRENYRHAARMADKILRGARPADLPVEQPERFELIVNQRTAKAIGVKLSPVTILRATRIIE